jgi:hypothetical protein
MDLKKAKVYLEAVMEHKRAIPFRRYNGAVGRTTQGKNEGATGGQARWPVKSAEFLLNLLKNAESNAEVCCTALPWLTILATEPSLQMIGAGTCLGDGAVPYLFLVWVEPLVLWSRHCC